MNNLFISPQKFLINRSTQTRKTYSQAERFLISKSLNQMKKIKKNCFKTDLSCFRNCFQEKKFENVLESSENLKFVDFG